MALFIDGTDEYGLYFGDTATTGRLPKIGSPYAVFDGAKQDWIVTGLRYRWMAVLVRWCVAVRQKLKTSQ